MGKLIKIWKCFKVIWKWFNGKKTSIAACYWFVFANIGIFYPKGIPENIEELLVHIGTYLTAAGLGHKAIKGLDK